MSRQAATVAKVHPLDYDHSDSRSIVEFLFHLFVLIRFADACPERASGSEMDEQRKQQMAYQYLCHLEEAKVCVRTNFC